ncbi:MAG: S46 family peptidase [Holophagales bacterium]|jgi:hypothetical protein|nr:S46 family peptidase [Holophagales bacterium]
MKKLILPLMTTFLTSLWALRAEEGMWTFDNLPLKLLKEKYNFTPSEEWLTHVSQSAISLGGCSASFISPDGLMLTNHHCARGQVSAVSTSDNDLLKNGFVARSREEELKVNMSIRVLHRMLNVTDIVNAAVKPDMDAKAAESAKDAALQEAVDAMQKSTGLSCSAVRLYQGGEYWVYGYETFDDVRLVAAPEIQVAMFGGDFDNFTYPRHDLDFMLFRVYKDGAPYRPENFLKWSVQGLKAGDLTFVVGHPGTTARGMTYSQMAYARDLTTPNSIKAYERQRRVLLEYGKSGEENKRAVQTTLLGVENGLKASKGYYAGLLDEAPMARVKAREDELRARVNKDDKLKATVGNSWDQIDKALEITRDNALLMSLAQGVPTPLLTNLRGAVAQIETGDAPPPPRRPMVDRPDLNQMQLEAWLQELQAALPPQNSLVQAALKGQTPGVAAKSILASAMNDESARKALIEGGKPALEAASGDHAVALAKALAAIILDGQKKQIDADAIIKDHAARIARARFEIYGKETYPDATGTLRLTFGPVSTFEANGTLIQPFTTFGGLYDRYAGWGGNEVYAYDGAWSLPQRWLDRRHLINPDIPLNFSHSVDIIGGNSGSPVIDIRGEVVGLIFDGNITMLPGRYYYNENNNRGVSVDARAIIETLDKVMDAKHIVNEILGSGARVSANQRRE